MTNFDVEIKGLRETQRRLEQAVADLHGTPILNAMREATLMVQRDARLNAPVDTGRLRASITPGVKAVGNTVQGVVGSNVEYAPAMELGTGVFGSGKRHWPPSRALETWARRHGFSSGFVVARAIGLRGGLKARRFLQRAFERNQKRIVEKFEDAVEQISRRANNL